MKALGATLKEDVGLSERNRLPSPTSSLETPFTLYTALALEDNLLQSVVTSWSQSHNRGHSSFGCEEEWALRILLHDRS